MASTDDITGYAFNPLDTSLTDSVEVVISGGPTPQTVLANEPSPELQSVLGTSSHDFTYAMPVLSVGAHTVTIYAIDTNTSTNTVTTTLLATTTVTSQNSLFDEHYYLATTRTFLPLSLPGRLPRVTIITFSMGNTKAAARRPIGTKPGICRRIPDVAAAVKAGNVSSGFMQYYLYGQYENRPGLLYFNTSYYLQNNPRRCRGCDCRNSFLGFDQFVLYGQYEGRSPMLYFSSTVYDANNPFISAFCDGRTDDVRFSSSSCSTASSKTSGRRRTFTTSRLTWRTTRTLPRR